MMLFVVKNVVFLASQDDNSIGNSSDHQSHDNTNGCNSRMGLNSASSSSFLIFGAPTYETFLSSI